MYSSRFAEWLINNISLHEHDSRQEELANAGTHGLGIILSIAAIVLMVLKVTSSDSRGSLTGVLIFGFSMVLLYSSSTFYHLSKGPVIKRILRIMDHSTIYFLIAGTISFIRLMYLAIFLPLNAFFPTEPTTPKAGVNGTKSERVA